MLFFFRVDANAESQWNQTGVVVASCDAVVESYSRDNRFTGICQHKVTAAEVRAGGHPAVAMDTASAARRGGGGGCYQPPREQITARRGGRASGMARRNDVE